jgi:hypothetical protein
MTFEITLRGDSVEKVGDVDAYQQEGQLTTFFQLGSGRHVLDAWSTRIASYRTSEIVRIRLVDENAASSSGRVVAFARGSA